MEDGLVYALRHGTMQMQLLYVENWAIQVKVLHRFFFFFCSEILLNIAGARASCCGLFGTGPDKQPHFRDRFNCRGDERNLSMCPRSVGADCPANQQDVVVLCS